MHHRGTLLLALTSGICVLAACAPTSPSAESPGPGEAPTSHANITSPTRSPEALIALPPAGATPDYQLGGAYTVPEGVGIVGRDRGAPPVAGVYSICYVNAFQTQPGESDLWPSGLLLRNRDGSLVHDPDWPDEIIVDTRDPTAVATIVEPWITGCATDGFDAVEFDNLDTYTRTDGTLSRDDNLDTAALLVDIAHDLGLAAAQKNAAEDAMRLRAEADFDFAVVEECAAYDECSAYTEVYGTAVVAIEYTDNLPRPFADVCADEATPRSVVLRDRALVTPDQPAYAFETCR